MLMDGNQKPDDQSNNPLLFQPGTTITPGVSPVEPSATIQQPAQPAAVYAPPSAEAPAPSQEVAPAPTEAALLSAPQPPAEIQPQTTPDNAAFIPAQPGSNEYDEPPFQTNSAEPSRGPISWTASEFIAHSKSLSWYMILFGAAAAISVLVWLLTKDVFSAAVVLVAIGVLGAYGSRKPRELQYIVDEQAVSIGQKQYGYHTFRSFSVIIEGAFSSIEFIPLKRFAPAITIYYDPKDEDDIVDVLSQHLPFEPRKRDAIDQLMHRIRF